MTCFGLEEVLDSVVWGPSFTGTMEKGERGEGGKEGEGKEGICTWPAWMRAASSFVIGFGEGIFD
jgi:hypothetical protein